MRLLLRPPAVGLPCVVMIDPYTAYARSFAERAFRMYGLSTFSIHTDDKTRFYNAQLGVGVASALLIGSIQLDGKSELRPAARLLRTLAWPLAVVPLVEVSMCATFTVADELDVLWSPLDTLQRFRDKHAMKSYLRRQAPELRITPSRRVTDAKDVYAAPLPQRFIIKPNAGYGNRDVRSFVPEDRDDVDRFLTARVGTPMVLEEYVGGVEYFVNGQIDATGNARIVAVFEYQRRSMHGVDTITAFTRQVHQDETVFGIVASYTVQVMGATGLRRSPFHMDVKVDSKGASLIEVGARLAGMGNVYDCNMLHDGQIDLFDLALGQLLRPDAFTGTDLDWRAYNSRSLLYVHGISARAGILARVEGVEAVEAMPEFHRWIVRPSRGARMVVTRDLQSIPYLAVLTGERDDEALALAGQRVRDTLVIEDARPGPAWVIARLRDAAGRARRRSRWVRHVVATRIRTARSAVG